MIKVRVPGTSANMGPGFDTLGIALNVYNEYEFEEIEKGFKFQGIPEEFCNKENIIYKAMVKCFEKAEYLYRGISINVIKQDIPISRGLGSSSSCIVAGLIGANAIMGNKLSKDEIFKLAVEIEGHPDNVAPALYGGIVISIMDNENPIYNKIEVDDEIKFIALIPDFRLSTEAAREVLPEVISMKDGVYNVGRVAMMVSAFATKNYNLLRYACKDQFHQRYRSKLIKNFDYVYNKCYYMNCLCCYLSGAGPTMMSIVSKEDTTFSLEIEKDLQKKGLNWKVIELKVDNQGAQIIKGEL